MKTVKIKNWIGLNKKIVKVYDGIKEMPAENYHEMQKTIIQDAGIGSDMKAVGQRLSRMYQFIQAEDMENVAKEAKNLHNTFFFIINGINVKSYAFAALIHSINGRPVDITKPRQIIEQIKGFPQSEIEDTLFEVKKNLIQNFERLFLTETMLTGSL